MFIHPILISIRNAQASFMSRLLLFSVRAFLKHHLLKAKQLAMEGKL